MSLAEDFIPPIAIKAINYIGRKKRSSPLFDGDDSLFIREALRSEVYGEYGMGASTLWMVENTDAQVMAVDTSEDWVNHVFDKASSRDRLSVKWIDVGPVAEWGYPETYSRRENFRHYVESIWEDSKNPDLILIDGRFRVACFLTSVLRASPGTRIIFDDYAHRGHYHVAEEFVPCRETCGRQALFVVPEFKNGPALEQAIEQFLYVRE